MGDKKDMLNLLRKLGVKDGKIKEKVKTKPESFDVVHEDHTTHPITEAICPKCGNSQAYWWTKQTRASDEPETRFLQCTQCKYTWRESS